MQFLQHVLSALDSAQRQQEVLSALGGIAVIVTVQQMAQKQDLSKYNAVDIVAKQTGISSTKLREWMAWGKAVAKMPNLLAFKKLQVKSRNNLATIANITQPDTIGQLKQIDSR